MSDEGIYKQVEESDLPELDTTELREYLEPSVQISSDVKLWQVLPDGRWMRIR